MPLAIAIWSFVSDKSFFRSNGIRNDLQHPNEYIRGNTLRFLSKLREPELIEPLLSSARLCLQHRHAYVRKNAVWAVSSIFQHTESLIPDAPELLQVFDLAIAAFVTYGTV